MSDLDIRALIDVINSIVTPVNASLIRHSEAVATAITMVQRLAEIVQQEPTRVTLLNEMKDSIKELTDSYSRALDIHDKQCEKRGTQFDSDAIKRAEDVLMKATNAMDVFFDNQNEIIKDILKPVSDINVKFAELEKKYDDSVKKVETLTNTIRIAAGIGVFALGWAIWLWTNIPQPVKTGG